MAPILFLVLCLIPAAVGAAQPASRGFSLELIHRDSPKSPLYPGNLTSTQRMKRLLDRSASRDLWLKSKIFGTKDVSINVRPEIHYKPFNYLVRATFGSDAGKKTFLLTLDTGSEAVWTQCVPCEECFHMNQPIIDPNTSPTWNYLECPSPLCSSPDECIDGVCFYRDSYGDGSSVQGILATDNLTLGGVYGNPENIPDFAFACAHKVLHWIEEDGYPEGVFGMSRAPLSFAAQMKDSINGRFSYCLPEPDVAEDTFMRFGNDIVIHGNEQRVPFGVMTRPGLYYLDLIGISIGRDRLVLPPSTFARQPDGSGGFIIDSGSTISKLITTAYAAVKGLVEAYFDNFGLPRRDPVEIGIPLDLCYALVPEIDRSYPTMTLHFQGADLEILTDDLLPIVNDDMFCLAVMPSDIYSVLGAEQQHDIRFTYDLVKEELLFVRDNCAHA